MTSDQGFLQQVFGGLAAFAQQHLAEHRRHQERLTTLRERIEAVVDASEPRLRLVGNYADKLLDAVETASIYAERVLQQLPPAITLDAQTWSRHPEVNAFFATVDDLRKMLAEDSGLQHFFQESGAERGYALMLMVKRETETFGAALRGDVLVRDVRQIRVSFSKHRLFFPTTSEKRLREDLQQRMLAFLATRALERINEIRDRRSWLEEQRRRLQAQLRALRSHAQGLQPLLSAVDPGVSQEAALKRRLVQVEEELVAVRKRLGTLDDYLEQVRQVLSQPEQYLQVRPLTLRLTRLGVKLSPQSTEPGETLSLIELDSLGEQRIGALVRLSRIEALPPPVMTTI
ncbi:MAG: hypothetical protein KDJ31_09550 [Candidatus Competibacteraceae bacterium]|nr:hypothetical protein [Candidatus Competibacteraceae bacterium]MCB1821276.1 hypothetical protein [Candidatus Competibacteraceae bacterium]HRY16025.1 hypothetical protein [Candidatus Competibacteraceae bacterium]